MEDQNTVEIFKNILATGGRKPTRVVHVGEVPLGGNFPVRVQSMTTTPTMDTEASVAQCIRIIEAGADFVRLTAQNLREAENLGRIRSELRKRGIDTPLIADVHFNPSIAEVAATQVEKIRINPGNFIRFHEADSEQAVQDRIRERLVPLLEICKKHKTALRIGVNHGSLAGRIVEQYGDTPKGMVVSAMEFLRICREEDFHQVVLSMKSSNTRVMVYAYRLLIAAMAAEGALYPLHLGITEAGEGIYGRIKSTVGIVALLADGFGDTIRVSLTEPPENEIPVARFLVLGLRLSDVPATPMEKIPSPFAYSTREVYGRLKEIFGTSHIVVSAFQEPNNDPSVTGNMPDLVYADAEGRTSLSAGERKILVNDESWNPEDPQRVFPFFRRNASSGRDLPQATLRFLEVDPYGTYETNITLKSTGPGDVFVINLTGNESIAAIRSFLIRTENIFPKIPVILRCYLQGEMTVEKTISVAALTGPLFLDGLADGLWIESQDKGKDSSAVEVAFSILQASRVRFTQPEYISCPSCGRTLFDIQKVSAEIRKRTAHLKGLKIGIMGCIVNGPGEMADADYGYVGSGTHKITLYKNRKVVKRNIPAHQAVDELIRIIKENGNWTDP
ncbi:MAG: (E)-4-hydroxy-3-methylbut-2-enyl-diphosphate synthase [Chlorobi bacterium]|nr:(E)-4-hydroxy-3-methylbut-2-enyl-diphosphate synthase [Chlorobiota bacterium]